MGTFVRIGLDVQSLLFVLIVCIVTITSRRGSNTQTLLCIACSRCFYPSIRCRSSCFLRTVGVYVVSSAFSLSVFVLVFAVPLIVFQEQWASARFALLFPSVLLTSLRCFQMLTKSGWNLRDFCLSLSQSAAPIMKLVVRHGVRRYFHNGCCRLKDTCYLRALPLLS